MVSSKKLTIEKKALGFRVFKYSVQHFSTIPKYTFGQYLKRALYNAQAVVLDMFSEKGL